VSGALTDYLPWIGVWAGVGETQAGQDALIRTEFYPAMDSAGLAMHFEAWDVRMSMMYHGVRAMLAPAPSGVLRALAFSTIHGALLLELTPDDEGVMALAGESLAGNRISVTFVQEGPDHLLFTASWRPPHAKGDDEMPRMTCLMKRSAPMKAPPISPPKA
jgi:hypothetical protein